MSDERCLITLFCCAYIERKCHSKLIAIHISDCNVLSFGSLLPYVPVTVNNISSTGIAYIRSHVKYLKFDYQFYCFYAFNYGIIYNFVLT